MDYSTGLTGRKDLSDMSNREVVDRVCGLTKEIVTFWSHAMGWAPIEAAELLSKSRLDRQYSLSRTLYLWVRDSSMEAEDGELILAWVNLGALVEGTLKLLLSIFYQDYLKEQDKIKKFKKEIDPDEAMLDGLKKFCERKGILSQDWIDWISRIQTLRNSIHAYKECDIETFESFHVEMRMYLVFLRDINSRLPYPDVIYEPRQW